MKKTIFIFILLFLFINGCKKNSQKINYSLQNFDKKKEIVMEIGKKYQINKGDKIIKISSKPKIQLEIFFEQNKSFATLISGKAKIIKNPTLLSHRP